MITTFFRYHFPALLWAAVILFLTLLPSASLPETPDWKLLSFDTLAHAGVFGLLALLVARSFYFQYSKPQSLKSLLWVTVLLCTAFGILIEVLQTVMHLGRHGETGDAISDLIGAVAGALCFYLLARFRVTF